MITTKIARASFVQVFEMAPLSRDSDQMGYSIALLIPKSDALTYAKIQGEIESAINKKFAGKRPPKFDDGVRDGDVEAATKGSAYIDHWVINAKSRKHKPGLVDKDLNMIIDPSGFKSGDYCRASIEGYGYDVSGKKGCGWGVVNIQKLRDGEPLGGARISAEVAFDDDYVDSLAPGETPVDSF